MLLLSSRILSKNLSKNHETQDDNLSLLSYKIDSRINNIKIHELKPNRGNYDDVLTNTNSNSQNRTMIVDDEHDIARLFAITLERNGFVDNSMTLYLRYQITKLVFMIYYF